MAQIPRVLSLCFRRASPLLDLQLLKQGSEISGLALCGSVSWQLVGSSWLLPLCIDPMKRTCGICRCLCGILSGKEQPCIMESCRGPRLLPHRRPPHFQHQHLSVDQILHLMLASWTWTARINTSHSHPKIESNFPLKISGHRRVFLSHSSLRKTEAAPVDLLGMYAMSASLVAPIKDSRKCLWRKTWDSGSYFLVADFPLPSVPNPPEHINCFP